MSDSDTTLDDLKKLVIKFRGERNWNKEFTPRSVAISIAVEAAELLEHYQWETYSKVDKAAVTKELADVLIFAFHFATLYDIDISTAFQDKLRAAGKKYPKELFDGSAKGVDHYTRIKAEYRRGK